MMSVTVARGLAVIRRINWFEDPPKGKPVPHRRPSLNFSHQEILARYRGVEGWLWPEAEGLERIHLISGLAGEGEMARVIRYFQEVRREFLCDLIYCEIYDSVPVVIPLSAARRFLGFDYGYLRSETDCFSMVLNEVVYGTSEPLRRWSSSLNQSLLLPSLEAVSNFNRERQARLLAGDDLEVCEPGEPAQTIAVFEADSARGS